MKILIIKTSSLGDMIQTFPVLSFLHQKFPEAQIDWVVEKPFAPMLQAHPFIQRVLCIHTKEWRKRWFSLKTWREIFAFRKEVRSDLYDVVFDLQSNIKSSFITLITRSLAKVGFGRKSVHEWPNLFVTNRTFDPPKGLNIREDYLFLAQSYFKDFTPFNDPGIVLTIDFSQQKQVQEILEHPSLAQGKKVMVCSGSNWANKQMKPEEMIQLLKRLQAKVPSSFLLMWGSPEEKQAAEMIHKAFPENSCIVDRLPIPVLQNLMARVNLVVSMDSLPLHLAGTTATPTLSVFGPSLAKKYQPLGPQHQAVQGQCPYGRTFEKRCPILRTCPTGACIHSPANIEEISFPLRHSGFS